MKLILNFFLHVERFSANLFLCEYCRYYLYLMKQVFQFLFFYIYVCLHLFILSGSDFIYKWIVRAIISENLPARIQQNKILQVQYIHYIIYKICKHDSIHISCGHNCYFSQTAREQSNKRSKLAFSFLSFKNYINFDLKLILFVL